ncbi:MAG: carbohydrate ABC transporter permease [Geminicoccaceae bacterium]
MKFSGEQRRTALLLISPAVIVLLAINLFPFVYAVYISFHHWTLARPQPPRFAGWFNYEEALTDDRFINAIWVSLSFVTLAVAVEFILGFLLAFVFHARLRGLATLRKISILPVMVMPLVVGLVWFYMFNENFGVVNWVVTLFGSPRLPFLTHDTLALWSLAIADVWQWTPFVMLVLFAALQSLPEYVYEAARMDGLSGWQIFWRITLPLLRPAIWVVLILRIVDAFRMVELVFMMTKGGPAGYTEVLPWYLYTTGFLSLDLGYAAAMAVLMLILVTIVSQLFVRRLAYKET